MRFSTTLSALVVLAAAAGLATQSLAQTTPAPANVPTGPNADMQLSRRECANAVRVMGKALPIYHGHRVRAIEIAKIAIDEIRLGLKYDRGHGSVSDPTAIQQRLKALENMSEPGGNYTTKQNNQSNKKMLRAQAALTKAQGNLQAAPKDYGGHRSAALQLVNLALAQIQQALGTNP
jgi:hypothetical protein